MQCEHSIRDSKSCLINVCGIRTKVAVKLKLKATNANVEVKDSENKKAIDCQFIQTKCMAHTLVASQTR